MNHQFVTAPEHIAACDLGPVTVLVDYSAGTTLSLLGPASPWWSALAATGDGQAPTTLDTRSVRYLLTRLLAAGFLTPTSTPRPWSAPQPGQPWAPSWGVQEVSAGRAPLPRVPRSSLALAVAALGAVLLAEHAGHRKQAMARLIAILRTATVRTTRPATDAEARRAVHAVRQVGLFLPGRLACLEESVTVVLMLAVSRLRVNWCHGVAADPVRLHAWVETSHGEPVAEPPSTLRYTTLLTVPPSSRR
ncbi:MAG TPA: lasso peptide biosynthesis B2 protein [Pseudonocardiaceae bacterium]|nr:lasso peptide biosynthesis B2 protein [Pseudonocardiaceae bacterium]